MVETILFDLDDTLLDFGKAEASALRRVLTEIGAPADNAILAHYHGINQRQWELLELGQTTRAQLRIRRFEILFDELGVPCDPQAVCDRYEQYLGEGHWFMPGAQALLETLAPKYNLYLVSNGSAHVQRSRLKITDIARYFKGIFISHELGVDKPSREYFDRCFAAMPEVNKETTVIVGDSLTSDILGGKNVGIRTCWYNPKGKAARPDICPDYEFDDLADLPALLERI